MKVSSIAISQYNPYPTFQPGQKEAISDVLDLYESGEKIIELDAPTAAGKSLDLYVLGMVLANQYGLEKVVYTTPLVALVNQLQNTKEFSGMPVLKGKRNYSCAFRPNTTADDCPFDTIQKDAVDFCRDPRTNPDGEPCCNCIYCNKRSIFMDAPFGATTLARYMIDPRIKTESTVLLIDESAGLEQELVNRTALKLPQEVDLKKLPESLDDYIRDAESEVRNLETQRELKKSEMITKNESDVERKRADRATAEVIEINRKISRINRYIWACTKIRNYIAEGERYVIDSQRKFQLLSGRSEFLRLIENIQLTVLASGTPTTQIFDIEYKTVPIQHPIPVERRTCYYLPVGSMALYERATTAPKMAKAIESLHSKYRKKTIVHCGAYSIGKLIYDNMSQTAQSITILQEDPKDREYDKSAFLLSSDERIFLSIKFNEGLDLKGPEYPLNIITKIPFENFGDEYIKQRNIYDNHRRYNLNAAVAVMQAAGRCTRSIDDFSETYILDSSWKGFFNRNRKLFKPWFVASLVDINEAKGE